MNLNAGSKSLWKQETSKIFAVHLPAQFQSLIMIKTNSILEFILQFLDA
jgi:hypothetical protein